MITTNLIICAGSLAVLTLVLATVVGLRYLSYRETLALLEKGLVPPERNKDSKLSLRWGIILAALGLALCIGLYPLGTGFGVQYPFGLGPWMLLGLIPLFFGLALILIYVASYHQEPPGGDPGRREG